MKQGSLRSSAYAVLTAFIWGTAFVAQSVGAEHVPPLAFNAARSVIAFVFLLVLCGVFTLDQVPNLFNLKTVVSEIINSVV